MIIGLLAQCHMLHSWGRKDEDKCVVGERITYQSFLLELGQFIAKWKMAYIHP